MAVAGAAAPSSFIMHVSPDQIRIATRTLELMNDLMRGVMLASVNPRRAIPPTGDARGIRGPGIGTAIDFQG